ncbi:MAG: fluoride efflux transporter CrcB [bacterium]|nr:fluoride efflux transporter CrcB [bacterium]
MRPFILIGLAGALGAISRYGVSLGAQRLLGNHFAYGTLLVNVIGCLALGIILELENQTQVVNSSVRLFVAVGFLGAFTTFSTFGFETLKFIQQGQPHLAFINIALNLILGLLAVWMGWGTARFVAHSLA